jgi:diaminopropionate ammonia-lyase
MRFALNPAARRDASYRGFFTPREYDDVDTFYAGRPDLGPTPLRRLDGLAAALGLDSILAKDESARFGLNAFKIAGVRYALDRVGAAAAARGVTCATAGNHGRAVARAARDLDVACTVFVAQAAADITPIERATRASRIAAMRGDGARIVDVPGTYEDAVARAVAHGRDTGALIVSDTSWPGYEDIPKAIMAGYTRLFAEAETQWDRIPDIVVVQGGVGGLVCAAASWLAHRFGPARPFLIACEPDDAACLMASAEAGRPVTLKAGLRTMMAGLRCAEPSPAAWPAVRDGVDAFVSVGDDEATRTMDRLSSPSGSDPAIFAGPSGACGVAALIALAESPEIAPLRDRCRLGRSTLAMVVVTEGE